MRPIKIIASTTCAALGPFGVVTTYLLASRFLPGSIDFLGWIASMIFGIAFGIVCLFLLTPNRWRRMLLVLAYVPLMGVAILAYSFYFTGAVLGETT
jgi:hypothetical protein